MVIILLILIFSNTSFAADVSNKPTWFVPGKIGQVVTPGDLVAPSDFRVEEALRDVDLDSGFKRKVAVDVLGLSGGAADDLAGASDADFKLQVRAVMADVPAAAASLLVDDLSDDEYESNLRRKRRPNGSVVKNAKGEEVRVFHLRRMTAARRTKLVDSGRESLIEKYWRKDSLPDKYFPYDSNVAVIGFGSCVDTFTEMFEKKAEKLDTVVAGARAAFVAAQEERFASKKAVSASCCSALACEGCFARHRSEYKECMFCKNGEIKLKEARKPADEDKASCVTCAGKMDFRAAVGSGAGSGGKPTRGRRKRRR